MTTVICENCGMELPKDEAFYWEDAGYYYCPDCADECLTTCERCGAVIDYDCSYQGFDGRLCDICHDDLFG